ncbi:MAG: helix-turn-helix transcriptional regulator [Coriobacteriales bacterium]|nr:helix-turn-helix transcriptional regulator [Coriobacteriales bacterium]
MTGNQTIWETFQSFQERGSFRLLANTPNTVVIRVENETGEGDMIVYRVFDGIYLMFNDYHMAYYDSTFQAAHTVFAVDYCREGHLVMECENGLCQVKKAGSVCIDSRVHHKGVARFPTSHYHGITIGFESNLAGKTLDDTMSSIPVDLTAIREKYCSADGFYIMNDQDTLNRIFMDLYHAPEKAKISWFRAKIMELLICLQVMEPQSLNGERPYFYKDQVEKVHAAAKLLTEDLREDHTIEELARTFNISLTAFKNCFKSVYGKPVFTWLTAQRMQKACELLLEQPNMPVSDIAYEIGYENVGKFCGVFKRTYGMSPREYRNNRGG